MTFDQKKAQLEAFLGFLKKHYPLNNAKRLLVNYNDTDLLRCEDALSAQTPELATTDAYFAPLVATRTVPYDGFIDIAVHSKHMLHALCHEYRHAMQHDQGIWSVENCWEMESDAISFARVTVKEYLAAGA